MAYFLLRIKCLLVKGINFSFFKGVILFDVPEVINSKNVKLGRGVRINGNVFIHGAGGVSIGENVTLSYGVTILSTGYDLENWSTNKFKKMHVDRAVIIEDNVWLGANVTVVGGVRIAEGAVVAAGAVVTKNLDSENSLYAGVPAKKIKELN